MSVTSIPARHSPHYKFEYPASKAVVREAYNVHSGNRIYAQRFQNEIACHAPLQRCGVGTVTMAYGPESEELGV